MLYIALSAAVAHSDLLEVFPQLSFSYQVYSVLNYKKKKSTHTFSFSQTFIDILYICIFH